MIGARAAFVRQGGNNEDVDLSQDESPSSQNKKYAYLAPRLPAFFTLGCTVEIADDHHGLARAGHFGEQALDASQPLVQ